MGDKVNIYRLRNYPNDPRFEGFLSKSLRIGSPRWRLLKRREKLKSSWKPIRATGRVRRFNDFPTLSWLPAFSPRAVAALGDMLEANGELLPFNTALGEYFLYNVLTVADVLKIRRKIILPQAFKYDFFSRKLAGLTIFAIPQDDRQVYVTDTFVHRSHEAGLQGLNFEKVWPFPPGVSWWQVAREERQKHRQAGLAEGRDPTSHSLIINFKLASPNSQETMRDSSAIRVVMDQLDALLRDPESAGHAAGNVELYESRRGTLRLILSCPDANVLAKKLKPFLAKLKWRHGFTVQKRRSDFRTFNALFK